MFPLRLSFANGFARWRHTSRTRASVPPRHHRLPEPASQRASGTKATSAACAAHLPHPPRPFGRAQRLPPLAVGAAHAKARAGCVRIAQEGGSTACLTQRPKAPDVVELRLDIEVGTLGAVAATDEDDVVGRVDSCTAAPTLAGEVRLCEVVAPLAHAQAFEAQQRRCGDGVITFHHPHEVIAVEVSEGPLVDNDIVDCTW
mmetsp:Transcript_18101/g.38642  ORF Transcript_18101/g.38642 Transcript_18101/m.38642 type:complete len:201 (-) Transcript_18101:979-1581(-)